jgi:tRNA(Ile)-lysidine synthase
LEDISTQLPVASTQLPVPGKPEARTGNWLPAAGNWQLIYHFFVHELADRFRKAIRKGGLINAGDRVAVAVSGGADSVALLLLLAQLRDDLGIVLSVAHVNHELRGSESDGDERFVATLANEHGLELHCCKAPLARTDSGIEAAARKLRYEFFQQLALEGRFDKIATAHTQDDQAETVLMRIMRGTGIRGLAGIHPRTVFEGPGEVVRPLLTFRRVDLEAFLHGRHQHWHEDSSNRDQAFLRNRVRHGLVPLLKEDFGAAVVSNLADLAEIARAEQEHWELGHAEIRDQGGFSEKIGTAAILAVPVAAQRRLLRAWLHANMEDLTVSFQVIEELRDLACSDAGRKLELPGGNFVRRTQRDLCLERVAAESQKSGYEYRLSLPGAITISEIGVQVEAILVEPEHLSLDESSQLLDPARLPSELIVRNWRAGDRFWPAHTKDEKKVKELLSDRHVTGAAKGLWPVAEAHGLGLVWMREFSSPAALQPPATAGRGLLIRVSAS